MSSHADAGGLQCGALGCLETADVVIDHPKHGQRTVCSGCAADFEVVRHV